MTAEIEVGTIVQNRGSMRRGSVKESKRRSDGSWEYLVSPQTQLLPSMPIQDVWWGNWAVLLDPMPRG